MVGLSIARRTRSGTLVGPGICRKCRPDGCESSLNVGSLSCARTNEAPRSTGPAPGRSTIMAHPQRSTCETTKDDVNAPAEHPLTFHPPHDDRLAGRLRSAVRGDVLFDRASR